MLLKIKIFYYEIVIFKTNTGLLKVFLRLCIYAHTHVRTHVYVSTTHNQGLQRYAFDKSFRNTMAALKNHEMPPPDILFIMCSQQVVIL